VQAITNAEFIVYHIPARLHRDREAIEGRMRVTNERILFDTMPEDANPKPSIAIEIRMSELKSVYPCNTYLFLPNGLLLTLDRGEVYKFAVWKRSRLAGYLNRRLQASKCRITGQ